ncbi:unnamed protein product, partial [marine sediment metagenome]
CRKELAAMCTIDFLADGNFDQAANTLIDAEKNGDGKAVRNVLRRVATHQISLEDSSGFSKALAAHLDTNRVLPNCQLLLGALYANLGDAERASGTLANVLKETTEPSLLMYLANLCAERERFGPWRQRVTSDCWSSIRTMITRCAAWRLHILPWEIEARGWRRRAG